MNGRDLLTEMEAAASRVRLVHLERLRSLGVPYASLAALGRDEHTVGVGRALLHDNGLWEPCDEGEPVVVQAVHDGLARELGDAGIIDLIAWRTSEPERWWWRCGTAWALGHELLDADIGEPVPVVATPAQWLSVAGEAVCPLDWSSTSSLWPALRHGPPLKFNDEALRLRVRNGLVQSAPMPTMEISNAA